MDKIRLILLEYRHNLEHFVPFEDIPDTIKEVLSHRKRVQCIIEKNKDNKEVQEFSAKAVVDLTHKFEYLKEKLEKFLKVKLIINED